MSLVSVHSYNKSNNNEYCGTAATYFIVSHNYEDKEKLQLWNKSSASTFRNINEDNDDFKKQWKNENILNITNKSTFSLHIAAYENSIEAVALDLTDNENIEEYKKEKFGSIKTSKQCFTDSLKFRNPFEFPRQQNVNQRNEPEVMRFSASQRLLGSQRPTSSQQIGNNDEQFVPPQMPPGAGTAEMHPAIVVVLGDIGHSPRMCFHVMSLTAKGIPVQYVGYQESRPNDRLLNDPLVTIIPISPPSPFISNLPSIISLCFKLIWMCGTLISTLFFKTASSASLILVQNPPGVPTLCFGYFASKIKGATFVIDWHNYTSSIIQYNYDLNNDNKSLTYIQMILKFIAGCIASFEGYFGRRAKFNFCVSNSMRIDLKNKWNVKAITHYDRPPSWKFRCLTIEDKHQFFWKLCQHPDFASLISQKQEFDKSSTETTLFSYRDKDGVSRLRNDRPLLLISSTSWTKDEDFGILLDALRKFDTSPPPKRSSLMLPKIFVVITGKGPMKEQYLQTMNKIRWRYVTIVTPWLEAEDYPIMLGCADLGVSLHASTSGLDLPMKVVDMLGCRVPVLAKKFDAIGELVKPTNGKLFKSMEELCNLLVEMSGGFPESSKVLTDLKNQLLEEHPGSWEAQWDANFWPPIENLLMSKLHEKRRRERFSDDGYSEESD